MTCRVWTTTPAPGRPQLLHIHDPHTEFVVGVGWSLYDEGVLASYLQLKSRHRRRIWKANPEYQIGPDSDRKRKPQSPIEYTICKFRIDNTYCTLHRDGLFCQRWLFTTPDDHRSHTGGHSYTGSRRFLIRFLADSPITIFLRTPDTAAANWALHASSIWVSSIYVSDHLADLHLEDHIKLKPPGTPVRVLELGASAGLPSILIAKLHPNTVNVTVTDYPDEALIKTLSENVDRNDVAEGCGALPFAWGTDPSPILHAGDEKFDLVIAADTLWNPDSHGIFIDALKSTLKKSLTSRIHLVVGLHTGRYTIGSFLKHALGSGFDLESIREKEVGGSSERIWDVTRENEDDKERRRWVIWIQLKWTTATTE
ncbi:hypothetical protein BDZ97DRAFT_1755711 [Flammula alnicola]|nr:hypothetical protein BDZ97DRAFT_1755711 [Flammula alnicola]